MKRLKRARRHALLLILLGCVVQGSATDKVTKPSFNKVKKIKDAISWLRRLGCSRRDKRKQVSEIEPSSASETPKRPAKAKQLGEEGSGTDGDQQTTASDSRRSSFSTDFDVSDEDDLDTAGLARKLNEEYQEDYWASLRLRDSKPDEDHEMPRLKQTESQLEELQSSSEKTMEEAELSDFRTTLQTKEELLKKIEQRKTLEEVELEEPPVRRRRRRSHHSPSPPLAKAQAEAQAQAQFRSYFDKLVSEGKDPNNAALIALRHFCRLAVKQEQRTRHSKVTCNSDDSSSVSSFTSALSDEW